MHDGATIARFVAMGLAAALLLFVLTWSFTAAGMPPFVGGLVAYAVCLAVAYLGQRGWSFGGRHTHRHAFPRYLATQALAALTSGAAMQFTTSAGVPFGRKIAFQV